MRFSPDGAHLVTAGAAPRGKSYIAVWSVADGKRLFGAEREFGPIHAMALLPDGTRMVIGYEGVPGIWTAEQVEDFYDAMSPLNDQLKQAPRWWILELWPVQYKVPIAPGEVELRTGMNLGRYRGIDDVEPKLHWTVLHREQHIKYKIQARTATHTKWRVVV